MSRVGSRARPGTFARWLALAAAAGPASGCSLIFSEGAPAGHAQLPYFDCSSDYAGPGADSAFAGLMVSGALTTASYSDEEWRRRGSEGSKTANVVAPLVVGALAVASAAVGFVKVNRCREAKSLLAARIMQGPSAQPRAYPPDPARPPADAWAPVPPGSWPPAAPPPSSPPLGPPPGPPVAPPPAPPVAPPMGPPPGANTPFSPPPGAPTAAPPGAVTPEPERPRQPPPPRQAPPPPSK